MPAPSTRQVFSTVLFQREVLLFGFVRALRQSSYFQQKPPPFYDHSATKIHTLAGENQAKRVRRPEETLRPWRISRPFLMQCSVSALAVDYLRPSPSLLH